MRRFVLGLFAYIMLALFMAFFRGTQLDLSGVVLCIAMMSISGMFYIIGGQYLISKVWRLRNSGPCAWTAGSQLAFVDGAQMVN